MSTRQSAIQPHFASDLHGLKGALSGNRPLPQPRHGRFRYRHCHAEQPVRLVVGPGGAVLQPAIAALPPLPGVFANRPSITRSPQLPSVIWPREACVVASKALMRPSPKSPTSIQPDSVPKDDGAMTMPHGAFSAPCEATRPRNRPFSERLST